MADSDNTIEPIKLGVCGLGRGFMLMLPTLMHDPHVQLVAATDTRTQACQKFASETGGLACSSLDAMCKDTAVEAVYVATPHELHTTNALTVAAAGKALLLEKPMALTLQDCRTIAAAVEQANTVCVIGPGHSFDEPYMQTARMIATGTYGPVQHIEASNYTNFIYRPRRIEEMQRNSMLLNQAPHQIDVFRLFVDEQLSQVRASSRMLDQSRPMAGFYTATLEFSNNVVVTLNYNGYGHFDSAAEFEGIGELGSPGGAPRTQILSSQKAAAERRAARTYGPLGIDDASPATHHEHFGRFVINCENATLMPRPDGVMVYRNGTAEFHSARPANGLRSNVIEELYNAMRLHKTPLRDAHWGVRTMEICHAIVQSSSR